MYATGVIELDRRDEVLALPTTAILRNGAETACMVIEGWKATRRPIETDLRVGPDTEIIGGLTEANDVIVVRSDAIAEGQSVEPLLPTTSK